MAVHHPRDADGPQPTGDRRLVIEHAKGALMLRYGIDSHQAFAVLLRWARATQTPVQTVAHTLVHGICEGSPADRAAPGSADALDGVPAPAQRPRPDESSGPAVGRH